MHLSHISLKQFRSYTSADFTFDKSITLITGKNGSGKTNLLEAIYVLLQGGSFRVHDREMIRDGDSWWRLDGKVDSEKRQVRYQLDHHPPKQLVAYETSKRFMYKDRLPVVLFEPNDLLLIHGSPSRRRDSLDMMLSSLSASYKTSLAKYERVLKQRNNALKNPSPYLDDQLFSWDILLSEYGVEILRSRRQLIEQLNELIGGYYGEIAGRIEELKIEYRHDIGEDITSSKFLHQLHTKLPLDKLRGTTSIGPHRDDISFYLKLKNANIAASRGEVRSIILSLKLAYSRLLEQAHETTPIILLDDVFSELDLSRQSNVIKLIKHNQIIMTDTKVLLEEQLSQIKLN